MAKVLLVLVFMFYLFSRILQYKTKTNTKTNMAKKAEGAVLFTNVLLVLASLKTKIKTQQAKT